MSTCQMHFDDEEEDNNDYPRLTSASASGLSIVPAGAFSNAFPIMQYCLLSTGKTPGTIGTTTLTGLVTS